MNLLNSIKNMAELHGHQIMKGLFGKNSSEAMRQSSSVFIFMPATVAVSLFMGSVAGCV